MKTDRYMAVACYTPRVDVSSAPSLTSASVIDSGESPDRPGASSSSDPGPEFCMRKTIEQRFWEKVNKDGPVHPVLGTSCWLWTAYTSPDGYGGYGYFCGEGRRLVGAHRFSYEAVVGAVPTGLELDHLCRVRNCVRPDHLEPVTRRVNVLRGVSFGAINSKKTECVNGHHLSGDNLLLRGAWRVCRTCKRAWYRHRTEQLRSLGIKRTRHHFSVKLPLAPVEPTR